MIGMDLYTLRCRVLPSLIAALPLALSLVSLNLLEQIWSQIGLTSFVWLCGAAIAGQLGRDRGKLLEEQLYMSLGGKPTTLALRHRDSKNLVLLKHRHSRISELFPTIQMPTAEQEETDPAAADATYEAAVSLIRNRSRDRKRFHHVFEENCNYGFRRNLWGLKPVAIVVCIISILFICAQLVFPGSFGAVSNPAFLYGLGVSCSLILVFWIFKVNQKWLVVPANAYAERLLESLDS